MQIRWVLGGVTSEPLGVRLMQTMVQVAEEAPVVPHQHRQPRGALALAAPVATKAASANSRLPSMPTMQHARSPLQPASPAPLAVRQCCGSDMLMHQTRSGPMQQMHQLRQDN